MVLTLSRDHKCLLVHDCLRDKVPPATPCGHAAPNLSLVQERVPPQSRANQPRTAVTLGSMTMQLPSSVSAPSGVET